MGATEWEAAIAADSPDVWWKMGTVTAGSSSTVDSFTRANSATSLGTATNGNAWTAHVGTWGISSNKGYLAASTPSVFSIATVEAGLSDGVFEADLVYPSDPIPAFGIVFRSADVNNLMLVEVTYASGGTLNLFKRVGGSFTSLGTVTTMGWVAGTTYTISVVMTGTLYRVYVDGALAIEVASATGLEANTRVGLYEFGLDAPNARWDNLTVSTLDRFADFGSDGNDADILDPFVASPLVTAASGWNGSDEAVTFPDPQDGGFLHADAGIWGAPTAFTVECIIRPTAIVSGRVSVLVEIDRADGTTGFVFLIDESTLSPRLQVNQSATPIQCAPTAPLVLGDWHHVAASFTDPGGAADKTLTVVVDGCVVETATTSHALQWSPGVDNLHVGRPVLEDFGVAGTWVERTFMGDFSEAVLWRSALSVAQIKAHAHAAGFRCPSFVPPLQVGHHGTHLPPGIAGPPLRAGPAAGGQFSPQVQRGHRY